MNRSALRRRLAAPLALALAVLASSPATSQTASPAPLATPAGIASSSPGTVPTPATTAAALPTPRPAGSVDVTRATLPNGLRVVIVRDPLAPVVTEIVNYLAGGQDTPEGFPGTAHAVEHMVAGRSIDGLSSAQLNDITTLLGGNFNADTQQAITQYYLTVPNQYLDAAMRIEAARMTNSVVKPQEWTIERGAIEQEVSRDDSSAFQRFSEKALAQMFAGTPYAHDPLGTRASFDKTTGLDLRTFYKKWYAPNNAILVIAGDVDPQKALAIVRTRFSAIPRRAVPAQPSFRLERLAGKTFTDQSDFPVPLGIIGYRLPGYDDPDYAAAQIATDVLGGARGDLAALQADGKILGAGVQYQPFQHAGIGQVFAVVGPKEDLGKGVALVDATVAAAKQNGLPEDQIDAARQREIASALFSRNSIDGLAQDWSSALAIEGLESPSDRVAKIRAVTKADVDRVLQTYFDRSTAIVGLLTPKPGAAPNTSGASGIHDSFGSKDAKPVALPAWAASLAAPAQVPPSLVAPVDLHLANGIRLIVQHESISPTVTVQGRIRHQNFLQEAPGKDGVASILDSLFSYGTASLDRVAFQKELDAIAADVGAGENFSLSVPSANVDRGMQLLADDLLHPALPPAAFTVVQAQTAQSLAGTRKTPDYFAGRAAVESLVPKNDPTLREATPETIAALSVDDVRAFQSAVYRPDLTTIVVAGDITPDDAKALVEKYFGSWQATGAKPETQLPPVPPNAPVVKTVGAFGRTQSSVSLAETTALRRGRPASYAIQLGDQVLGGGFYSTRLYRDLRATTGLVYNVGVSSNAGKTRAFYSVDFGCDPRNVERARAIVARDLRAMGLRDVTSQELQTAKNQIAHDLQLSEASVEAIAGGLAGRSELELPLDEPTIAARALLGTSAAAVRAAFAKYVDPARFVQINEGPESK